MTKFLAIFVVFGVVSISLGEAARFGGRTFNRNRFFARQEVAPVDDQGTNNDAPYPAAGKPDGPAFELPNEPAQPSNEYGPPSNEYGPPSNEYGPPSNEYGPPSSSDPTAPEQTDSSDAAAIPDEPEAERLVFIRGSNSGRISAIPRSRFAKLQVQPLQYQLVF